MESPNYRELLRYKHEDLLKSREVTRSTNRSFFERLLLTIGIASRELGTYLIKHYGDCGIVQSEQKPSSTLKPEKNSELAKWSLN